MCWSCRLVTDSPVNGLCATLRATDLAGLCVNTYHVRMRFIHMCPPHCRNLKPANILLDHRGSVKLCDFGLSKLSQAPFIGADAVSRIGASVSLTSQEVASLMEYLAPELKESSRHNKSLRPGPASDVYALGTWPHMRARQMKCRRNAVGGNVCGVHVCIIA
jgi:hypothetical protein